MGLPITLLGLGLQLRADADADRRRHVATLAGRLGYESVWFHAAPGDAGVLDEIGAVLAAGVTRVGAVFTGPPEAAPEWARIAGAAHPELLVDVPGEAGPGCVAPLGGTGEWGRRGYVRGTPDPAAAGVVLSSASRAQTAALAVAAALARTDGNPAFRVGVALGVSIGRTMGEAQARVIAGMERVIADDAVRFGSAAGSVHWLKHALLHWIRTGRRGVRHDMLRSGCRPPMPSEQERVRQSGCAVSRRCGPGWGAGRAGGGLRPGGGRARGLRCCHWRGGGGKDPAGHRGGRAGARAGAGRAGRAFDAGGPGLAAAAVW
jgi:hypothetical protein